MYFCTPRQFYIRGPSGPSLHSFDRYLQVAVCRTLGILLHPEQDPGPVRLMDADPKWTPGKKCSHPTTLPRPDVVQVKSSSFLDREASNTCLAL